jgi:hypothetical protein
MKTGERKLVALCTGGILLGALAVACGGGGGGSGGSGNAQISGALNKASNLQNASLGVRRTLLARVASWVGLRSAVAQAMTNCGHVEAAANDVPVSLLMNGMVVQTTTTNGDGHFTFQDLAPGDYVVELTLPSGPISALVIVQPGQTTNLTGELDVDCHDVDHDGSTTELALHVDEETDDGSTMEADETEKGGDFHGEVHDSNGKMKRESGHKGDRSDESDTENQGPMMSDSSMSGGGM